MTLIDRLSKLDGPDREVDAEVHAATNPPLRVGLRFGHIPAYTASVDAALALAERVLPGWHWQVDKCGAVLRSGHALFSTDHSVPAIALCIAILRAKEASNA